MQSLVLKILPPVWFLFLISCALTVHFFFPAAHVFYISSPFLGAIVGIALGVGGFALANYASMLFAREKTEILPTSPANKALITSGPFSYTRNPMYLGMIMTLLGIAIFLGTLPMFIAAAADFIILNFFFIPFEEEKMERQFGDRYRDYKRSVRRWL